MHALYGNVDEASLFAKAPEVRAALAQVKEIEERQRSNSAKVAELRVGGARKDSAPS